MANSIESESLVETKEGKSRKKHPFRDTVLVRISRKLKDDVGALSLEKHRTISKILDEALQEYLLSVKRQNNY